MSEQQRVVTAVVACMAILFAWQFFFSPPKPVEEPVAQRSVEDIPVKGEAIEQNDPKPVPSPEVAEAPAYVEKRLPITNERYRAELSTTDAAFTRFELAQYEEAVWVRDGKEVKQDRSREQPVSLVTAEADGAPRQALIRLDVAGKTLSIPFVEQAAGAPGRVDLAGTVDGLQVVAEITPDNATYQLAYEVRVTNLGNAPRTVSPMVTLGLEQFGGEGSMFSPAPDQVHGLCMVGGSMERKAVGDVDEGEQYAPAEAAGWAGIDRQYFLAAILPDVEGQNRCKMVAQGKTLWLDYLLAAGDIAPGQTAVRKFRIYAGPKRDNEMIAVSPLLKEAINYSLWGIPLGFLARPMVFLMNLFHGWTGSWGVAIMCLTLLVKLLLFPVTYRSVMSMRKMQLLKPELDKIKTQYANDKERQQLEQMKLFRERGVNPIGGCLPMLLQMPVWFALYRMLWSSVDLYHQPFLWIRDLTHAEPFPIMAICVGALTFVQQKTTPTTMDNQQMKVMMYMMPVMFSVFLIALPSGLVLYILVNSILTILQQLAINSRKP